MTAEIVLPVILIMIPAYVCFRIAIDLLFFTDRSEYENQRRKAGTMKVVVIGNTPVLIVKD